MKVIETSLDGVLILEPQVFQDERGFFYEAFQAKRFVEQMLPGEFKQDNISQSQRGVVRGLHSQKAPMSQGKLIRCLRGAIFDVAVDIRCSSKTYGQFVSVELSESNNRALYIPGGFAHGFQALEDKTTIWYRCSEYYSLSHEFGISPLSLKIPWPISDMIMSERDRSAPSFEEFRASTLVAP